MNATLARSLAAALALAALPAAAATFDYTFIEGGFLHRDADFDRDDRSGLRVAGSAALAAPLALFAEFDHTGNHLDQIGGGLLFHTPVSSWLDFLGGVSLEHVDTGPRADTGFGLRAGVRWLLPDTRFELDPELRYLDVLNSSATSLRVAVLYRLAPRLDVQGAVQGGDDDRFEAGLRYNFGGTGSPSGRRYGAATPSRSATATAADAT